MNRASNSPSIRAPASNYSHVVEVEAGSTLYFLAGQTGRIGDGTVPADIEAQLRACYDNIDAVLAHSGLTWRDVVRIKTFVVNSAMDAYREARGRVENRRPNPPPATTLMGIVSLARPELLVEVEVVAAKTA